MAEKNLLILERSAQNLQKITRNGKTMLEGVFAEFGIENRNGRIYEEKEYLPHLEYLKKDISNGNLLGELDHPERFEVALGNVSHRVSELWYDQSARQIKGRIEILEGTPKGQIAKSLLEAGVPLSISSRAAGTVNEDKTVAIQQIYTYDLVAKPGFESAQLHTVNEGANPRQAEINRMIKALNESSNVRKEHSINEKFGVINENISIIDLTDKYPHLNLREEAQQLIKNNQEKPMAEIKPEVMNEDAIQRWTELFTKELKAINERLDNIQQGSSDARPGELAAIKKYIEKIRKIQEDSLNWQSDTAKAVNKVATYANTLAEKSNKHYKLTQKIVETVDYNAKALNKTQDWTSEVAKVTNAIGETVDHNAEMLNGMNEWTTQIAKSVNKLNEWGEEKAKAINGMHEWTSSIAKNLNHSVNWTEDMLGRAISKDEAKRLIEYVELVSESKKSPELKSKINEMLKTNSITSKPLNEGSLKGISVIDTVKKTGNVKVDTNHEKGTGVEFDEKTQTIISKLRAIRMSKGKMPVGDDKLQMDVNENPGKVGSDGLDNDPAKLKAGLKKHKAHQVSKTDGPSGPTSTMKNNQNLKLDTKPVGHLKEWDSKTDPIGAIAGLVPVILMMGEEAPLLPNKNPDSYRTLINELTRKFINKLPSTEEFENIMDYFIKLGDKQIGNVALFKLMDTNPAIHDKVDGEYKDAINKFRKHLGAHRKFTDEDKEPIYGDRYSSTSTYESKHDIKSRKSNLDEKLSKIINTLEKEKSLDENVKSEYPFTQLLSEADRKRFAGLDATDKQKVANEIAKVPTTDSKVIVKLWENALSSNQVDEPLWLKLAPKTYRNAFDKASEIIKENLTARAEFYTLNTQYQIDNFWETSGIITKPVLTLNESITAKTPEESEQKLDTYVASVAEQMKRFNSY